MLPKGLSKEVIEIDRVDADFRRDRLVLETVVAAFAFGRGRILGRGRQTRDVRRAIRIATAEPTNRAFKTAPSSYPVEYDAICALMHSDPDPCFMIGFNQIEMGCPVRRIAAIYENP
jgi:hypothetical protein